MFDLPLTPATHLEGSLNVAALIATVPANFTIKGMFFKRFVERLGADFAAIARELESPPPDGKYIAFKAYSQRDYTRLAMATARKTFPTLPLREAMRRLGRDDMTTFADSVIGKVVLAMARDARTTLHRMPDAYAGTAPEMRLRAEELDARTVRIVVEPLHGSLEYILGQVEGIVLAFDKRPMVTVRNLGQGNVALDVQHA